MKGYHSEPLRPLVGSLSHRAPSAALRREERSCRECGTKLSRYNSGETCFLHASPPARVEKELAGEQIPRRRYGPREG
jgi:hypothetical protein